MKIRVTVTEEEVNRAAEFGKDETMSASDYNYFTCSCIVKYALQKLGIEVVRT